MADDLDRFLAEQLQDPAFAAAYEDAEQRTALIVAQSDARRRAGLSQLDVARLMGTAQSAVSAMEKQAVEPRLTTLFRYARAVGVRVRFTVEETSG
jgi:DNA-binding XRE family transcriptional regulator